MDTLVVLFDGDILLYRAGFAAEKRRYYLRSEGPETGPSFSSAKEAKGYCTLNEIDYEKEIVWDRVPEPVSHALHNLDLLIENSIRHIQKHMGSAINVYPYVFLTGCDKEENFRTILEPTYKGTRDPKHKPSHMEEMKTYLQEKYATIMTQGFEADDMFGQAQRDAKEKFIHLEPYIVMVSLDKDLLQIPGVHYDFTKDKIEVTDTDQGIRRFFEQMLIGDRVDNVVGIYGIGEVKAAKILHGLNDEDMAAMVKTLYVKQYDKHDSTINWEERYNKNCDLLWIWRKVPDECPYKTTV